MWWPLYFISPFGLYQYLALTMRDFSFCSYLLRPLDGFLLKATFESHWHKIDLESGGSNSRFLYSFFYFVSPLKGIVNSWSAVGFKQGCFFL